MLFIILKVSRKKRTFKIVIFFNQRKLYNIIQRVSFYQFLLRSALLLARNMYVSYTTSSYFYLTSMIKYQVTYTTVVIFYYIFYSLKFRTLYCKNYMKQNLNYSTVF